MAKSAASPTSPTERPVLSLLKRPSNAAPAGYTQFPEIRTEAADPHVAKPSQISFQFDHRVSTQYSALSAQPQGGPGDQAGDSLLSLDAKHGFRSVSPTSTLVPRVLKASLPWSSLPFQHIRWSTTSSQSSRSSGDSQNQGRAPAPCIAPRQHPRVISWTVELACCLRVVRTALLALVSCHSRLGGLCATASSVVSPPLYVAMIVK